MAETAYSARYMDLVEQAALMLLNLPVAEAHSAGAFYQALCLKRSGSVEEASEILRKLTDGQSAVYRSRALQTIGIIYQEQNILDDALRCQIEASIIAQDRGPLALLTAHVNVSAIKSLLGDHPGALADLDRLEALATLVGTRYPAHFLCFQNERAVELNALGRTEEAKHALKLALASPFAASYPEWEETRQEIEAEAAKNRKPASPPVALPNPFRPALARAPSRRRTARTSAIRLSPPVHSHALCTEPMAANCPRISPVLGRYIISARTRGPP
jgi:tetratricopeptide (TPR) repeat protein